MTYNFHLYFKCTLLFIIETAHFLIKADVCKDLIYLNFADLEIIFDLLSSARENSFLSFMSSCYSCFFS
jgi:hypothetical protein